MDNSSATENGEKSSTVAPYSDVARSAKFSVVVDSAVLTHRGVGGPPSPLSVKSQSLPALDLLKNGCERTGFYALVWSPHPRSLSVRWAISTFKCILLHCTYSSDACQGIVGHRRAILTSVPICPKSSPMSPMSSSVSLHPISRALSRRRPSRIEANGPWGKIR